MQDKIKQGQRRGGTGNRTDLRLQKRLPAGVRDTLETLYRALRGLEDGTIQPAQATAMASVARAIVVTFESSQVEERLKALEERAGGGP